MRILSAMEDLARGLRVASSQLSVVSKCYLIITLQGLKARRTLCITRAAEAVLFYGGASKIAEKEQSRS
ncbi:MAG TPA: hypothetical protein VF493_13265 [Terriglobales bacterium]